MSSFEDLSADLETHHIEGYTVHGGIPFSIPLVSHIAGNLWTGGCRDGVQLPDDFAYVVSLYPWERYVLGPDTVRVERRMADSDETLGAGQQVYEIAAWSLAAIRDGKTLIHCQAGLNRSSLVAGLAMVLSGVPAARAIEVLRERRSRAVLCNRSFEHWLRGADAGPLL